MLLTISILVRDFRVTIIVDAADPIQVIAEMSGLYYAQRLGGDALVYISVITYTTNCVSTEEIEEFGAREQPLNARHKAHAHPNLLADEVALEFEHYLRVISYFDNHLIQF